MPSATAPDPGPCPVTCPLQNCSGVPSHRNCTGPITAALALDTCGNRRQTRARVPDNPCSRSQASLAIRQGQRDARSASNVLALRLRDRSTGEHRTSRGRRSADVAGLSRSGSYRPLPGHRAAVGPNTPQAGGRHPRHPAARCTPRRSWPAPAAPRAAGTACSRHPQLRS
jgi:hypothetical protein